MSPVRWVSAAQQPRTREPHAGASIEPVAVKKASEESTTGPTRLTTSGASTRETAEQENTWRAIPVFTVSDSDGEAEPRVVRSAIAWVDEGP